MITMITRITREPITSHTSGYGFDGGNDNSNGNDKSGESFNFAATVILMFNKYTEHCSKYRKEKPELVLPLGDLSYHSIPLIVGLI